MGTLRCRIAVGEQQSRVGSVGVEPTPMDFQSIASTELAYFPYYGTVTVP